MELLNLDLNEIASKEILEKVTSLESTIESLESTVHSQRTRINELEKQSKGHETVLLLLNRIRETYSAIKASDSDSGGWYDSKAKNQYKFISEILRIFYGINQEQKGWFCYRGDGNLRTHLAVNYYNSKSQVCELLRVLYDGSEPDINFIMNFKMPYDWDKEKIKKHVQSPKYNTNGSMIGMSEYWLGSGAEESNVPHDLIMRSPHILEDDIFGTILTTIKNQRGEWYTLFALPDYNKDISKDQIQQLGRCLIKIDQRVWGDSVKSFIKKHIKEFCEETLSYLKSKATNDNQYNTLHWQNFPAKYQAEFFKVMPLDAVLKALNEYHCDLSLDEKTSLLREILAVS